MTKYFGILENIKYKSNHIKEIYKIESNKHYDNIYDSYMKEIENRAIDYCNFYYRNNWNNNNKLKKEKDNKKDYMNWLMTGLLKMLECYASDGENCDIEDCKHDIEPRI